MGRSRVARILQTNGFNSDWTRAAAQWLAEQDDLADAESRTIAERSVALARSAAIAGWLAFAATILFGVLQFIL